MITTQLAQNLVAIGMADLLVRVVETSYKCPGRSCKGGECCREIDIDPLFDMLNSLSRGRAAQVVNDMCLRLGDAGTCP